MSKSLKPHGMKPGFTALHCLPECAQLHAHCDNDAIKPSPTLLPPSPSAFNLSQHLGLFQWDQLFTLGGQSYFIRISKRINKVI